MIHIDIVVRVIQVLTHGDICLMKRVYGYWSVAHTVPIDSLAIEFVENKIRRSDDSPVGSLRFVDYVFRPL